MMRCLRKSKKKTTKFTLTAEVNFKFETFASVDYLN